jgi:membrane protein YqaA with SNARE-associated domain
MVDIKLGKHHLRLRFIDIFTLVMLIIIYTLVAVVKEGGVIYSGIANISTWWKEFGTSSTNYLLIAFLISIIGNSSVMIVIPYVLVIYSLSISNPEAWVLIGIVSGIGAALGEAVSYYVGRLIGSSKKVQNSEVGEKFRRIGKQFERSPKTVPIIVFIFAASPLPDDMILVPMGLMKYPYYKTILPCVLGKTILTGITCWLGFQVGLNQGFLESVANYYSWGDIIYLIVPSETVNPRADLISFSSIFIFIWIFLSINFDGLMKWKSPERKKFEQLLLEGGNKSLADLIEEYQVLNLENFTPFMQKLAEKYPNMSQQEDLFHFDKVIDKKEAFRQSLKFVEFFFDNSSGEAETEVAEVKAP